MDVLVAVGRPFSNALQLAAERGLPPACLDASVWLAPSCRHSGMVSRVLASVPLGAAPLIDWLEAWATAIIVDGRADAVGVDGAATLVDGMALAALLRRIDAAVRDADGASRPAIDLLVRGAGEGAASVTVAMRDTCGRGVGMAETIRVGRLRSAAAADGALAGPDRSAAPTCRRS